MRPIQLIDVHVGDTVTRMLGGTVPMHLRVTRENEKFVYSATPDGSDEWVFERDSGAEYDPGLRWGTEFGVTGSFIVEYRKGSR